jgi:cation diffusion facilitator family transporter
MNDLLKLLRSDVRAQRIACVAAALLLLMVLETGAGLLLGSIGLLADALHLCFHSIAMFIALYGVLVSRRRASFAFSYGYARYEVLAAFSNTVLLIFMQLFIFGGVVHRLVEPAAFGRDPREGLGKVVLGAAGVALNVWAMVLLGVGPREQLQRFTAPPSGGGGKGAAAAPAGAASAAAAAAAPWEGGMALHLYSDAMSSALLLGSALLAPHTGALAADLLQAVLSAAFTLQLAVPLAHVTALALLQSVPPSHAPLLERAAREACAIEGVLEVTAQNFWLQAPGHGVATAVLRVRHDASEGAVLSAAQAAYGRVAQDVTVQLVKDVGMALGEWRAMAAGGSGGASASAAPAAPPPAAAVAAAAAAAVAAHAHPSDAEGVHARR